MTCPPHTYILTRDPDDNVKGACECGEVAPAWKLSNTDRHQAASRKSKGYGRDWRGKAMTVVGDEPC